MPYISTEKLETLIEKMVVMTVCAKEEHQDIVAIALGDIITSLREAVTEEAQAQIYTQKTDTKIELSPEEEAEQEIVRYLSTQGAKQLKDIQHHLSLYFRSAQSVHYMSTSRSTVLLLLDRLEDKQIIVHFGKNPDSRLYSFIRPHK